MLACLKLYSGIVQVYVCVYVACVHSGTRIAMVLYMSMVLRGNLIVSIYGAESITTDAGHFGRVDLCQLLTKLFCAQLTNACTVCCHWFCYISAHDQFTWYRQRGSELLRHHSTHVAKYITCYSWCELVTSYRHSCVYGCMMSFSHGAGLLLENIVCHSCMCMHFTHSTLCHILMCAACFSPTEYIQAMQLLC